MLKFLAAGKNGRILSEEVVKTMGLENFEGIYHVWMIY